MSPPHGLQIPSALPPSAPSKRHTGPFLLLGDMEGSPAVSSRELCWCLSRLHLQDHPQSQSACRQEPQSSPSSPQLSLGVSCGLATCPLSHHGSRFPGQTPVSPHTLSHAFEQTDPWEREWDHKGHFKNTFIIIYLLAVLHTCRILVPLPGIEPTAPALEAGCLNHWTTWLCEPTTHQGHLDPSGCAPALGLGYPSLSHPGDSELSQQGTRGFGWRPHVCCTCSCCSEDGVRAAAA